MSMVVASNKPNTTTTNLRLGMFVLRFVVLTANDRAMVMKHKITILAPWTLIEFNE